MTAYNIYVVIFWGEGGRSAHKSIMYNVIVGSFGIEYNAQLVNREARNRGLSTSINNRNGKYCVEAGAFDEEGQALSMLGRVKGVGYIFAYIAERSSEKNSALKQFNENLV